MATKKPKAPAKKKPHNIKALPPMKWPEDKDEVNMALDSILEAMLPYNIEGYVCYVWGRDPQDEGFVDAGTYKLGKENPRTLPLMVSEALKQWVR